MHVNLSFLIDCAEGSRLHQNVTPITTSHVGFALDDGQQFRANKTLKLLQGGGAAIGLGQMFTHIADLDISQA